MGNCSASSRRLGIVVALTRLRASWRIRTNCAQSDWIPRDQWETFNHACLASYKQCNSDCCCCWFLIGYQIIYVEIVSFDGRFSLWLGDVSCDCVCIEPHCTGFPPKENWKRSNRKSLITWSNDHIKGRPIQNILQTRLSLLANGHLPR